MWIDLGLNTTSRYLDDILNIYDIYFDNMVSQIYHAQLQLNKAKTSQTEALHLFISKDIVSTKCMINVTILILKLSISLFKMVMFLILHPMEFIFLNSFDLPCC